MITKVHFTVEQKMEITYVDNMMTQKSIDDWKESYLKHV